ncbi:hypothetical protein DPMN_146402 [Dreissena polymorpha]|uniref:Uncharacterized protein n=1 Tax=Dreissena polymorpha TaxID=45954 RepID=A0A9D4F7U3_DREPO|nr:hypothetical protein DPMN_146402 [Dreissena polymorpha]
MLYDHIHVYIVCIILNKKKETSRVWLREWTRGGGTQCAQRSGETVSGLKTTAGDNESGHTGRAACCTPSAELRPDKN